MFRSKSLILLAFFGLVACSHQPKPGFEAGNFEGWDLRRLGSVGAAAIVRSPVRAGSFAASVTLTPDGQYGGDPKSELSDPFHAELNKEYWYRLSVFIPPTFEIADDVSCVLGQWHNVNPPGIKLNAKPPLAIRYAKGKLRITVSYSRGVIHSAKEIITENLYHQKVSPGAWTDFVFHVKWASSDQGFIYGWVDGVKALNYAGNVGYPTDPMGPYLKTGVYCDHSAVKPLTIYVDEYRRGTRAEDVLLPGEKLL